MLEKLKNNKNIFYYLELFENIVIYYKFLYLHIIKIYNFKNK